MTDTFSKDWSDRSTLPLYDDPVGEILPVTLSLATFALARLSIASVDDAHGVSAKVTDALSEVAESYDDLLFDQQRRLLAGFQDQWLELRVALGRHRVRGQRSSQFVKTLVDTYVSAMARYDGIERPAGHVACPSPMYVATRFLKRGSGDLLSSLIDTVARAHLFSWFRVEDSRDLARRTDDRILNDLRSSIARLRDDREAGFDNDEAKSLAIQYLCSTGRALHIVSKSELRSRVARGRLDHSTSDYPRWDFAADLFHGSAFAIDPDGSALPDEAELANRLRGVRVPISGMSSIVAGGLQTSIGGGTIIRIVGGSGAGKTAFAMSLGLALSPIGTRTLYLSCEEEIADLEQRLRSLVPAESRLLDNFDESFSWFMGRHLPHSDPRGHLDELAAILKEMNVENSRRRILPGQTPLVVVVDGFHEMIGLRGSDERPDNMARFLQLVSEFRRTGALVLLMSARIDEKDVADPVDYEVDTVLELALTRPSKLDEPPMRHLVIVKTRRQFSHLGAHEAEIQQSSGFRVIPRLATQVSALSGQPVVRQDRGLRYTAFDMVMTGWEREFPSREAAQEGWVLAAALSGTGVSREAFVGVGLRYLELYDEARSRLPDRSSLRELLRDTSLSRLQNASGRQRSSAVGLIDTVVPPSATSRFRNIVELFERHHLPVPAAYPVACPGPFISLHPGSRILLSGQGSSGKLGLAFKILTSKIVASADSGSPSRQPARHRKMLVVTFARSEEDVNQALREALGSHIDQEADGEEVERGFLPIVWPEVRTITLDAAYGSAERFLDDVVKILREARVQSEPFEVVVLDGLQHVTSGHPRLADSPMLWPLLFTALRRFGVTVASTYSFPDFGTSVGRSSLGAASEERGSGIRNVLEGVLASTDYHLELVHGDARQRTNKTQIQFVTASGQDVRGTQLVWNEVDLAFTLKPAS